MQAEEIERMWEVMQHANAATEKRKTPTDPVNVHEGASSKRPSLNKAENQCRWSELQKKLGYQFKEEEILKRALREDGRVLSMLGKSIMQTCLFHEECIKKNSVIPKRKLQKRLESFWKWKEYGAEARRLKLSGYVENNVEYDEFPFEANCYTAVIGAIALDSNIGTAASVFNTLRKWDD